MRMRLLHAACFAFAAFAAPAYAQVAIQPGTIVGTFDAQGFSSGSGNVIFTVPMDRAARVTDVRVHNFTAAQQCHVMVTFNATNTFFSVNSASETKHYNISSGYGMVSGTTAKVTNNGCADASIYVEIRGFYFTIP